MIGLMTGATAMNRREALRMIALAAAGLSPGLSSAASGAVQGPVQGAASMTTRKIPSSGEALPIIGLGTWQTFDVGPGAAERAPLQEVLQEFAALGGRLIDSSPMYGNSEKVAGDIIAKLNLREKLFIATKVWTSGKQDGIAQMNSSMEKLRARPIDLMQVHNLLDVETHLATLREWKQQGIVRHIGVTHYTGSAHDDVARVITKHPVDFIQINYSVGEREAEQRLLPLAREKGVAVIANRPFAGGDLFRRVRAKPLPAWAAEIGCTSWAQLLLKFVVSHPAMTCAIPATSKLEHLRDNMKAGYGRMPDQKMRAMIVSEAM
ncbi:aldo/keto reductase [Oxalobacteraceae bacterium R-40]|uniref:Aldo/keto reductase n=1 Tax=Keguizhuia sedimenti TaxID=3064264 RepID=A0ABU1BRL1_9BURK|nr:aldo/keto reductase [Oxalobacteraceae bacterium R-40]